MIREDAGCFYLFVVPTVGSVVAYCCLDIAGTFGPISALRAAGMALLLLVCLLMLRRSSVIFDSKNRVVRVRWGIVVPLAGPAYRFEDFEEVEVAVDSKAADSDDLLYRLSLRKRGTSEAVTVKVTLDLDATRKLAGAISARTGLPVADHVPAPNL